MDPKQGAQTSDNNSSISMSYPTDQVAATPTANTPSATMGDSPAVTVSQGGNDLSQPLDLNDKSTTIPVENASGKEKKKATSKEDSDKDGGSALSGLAKALTSLKEGFIEQVPDQADSSAQGPVPTPTDKSSDSVATDSATVKDSPKDSVEKSMDKSESESVPVTTQLPTSPAPAIPPLSVPKPAKDDMNLKVAPSSLPPVQSPVVDFSSLGTVDSTDSVKIDGTGQIDSMPAPVAEKPSKVEDKKAEISDSMPMDFLSLDPNSSDLSNSTPVIDNMDSTSELKKDVPSTDPGMSSAPDIQLADDPSLNKGPLEKDISLDLGGTPLSANEQPMVNKGDIKEITSSLPATAPVADQSSTAVSSVSIDATPDPLATPVVTPSDPSPTVESPVPTSMPVSTPASVESAPELITNTTYEYRIEQLLQMVVEREASDLHISTGYPAMIRVDGSLLAVSQQIVTPEIANELILPILPEHKKELLDVNREVDLAYAFKKDARFRINAYYQQQTLAAALRLIPNKIRNIDELKLPGVYHKLAQLGQGLVLVTGPTGSGKSTTLAAIIQEINQSRPDHIITIEDPIEYVFPKEKAMVDQRELHDDTHSWEIALKSALRQDPDVILVGEMRDFETISSAITLAETGHLVFATLHTNSAAQTIDRIIDVFPEAQQAQVRSQLSTVIEAVIAQRLVPLETKGRVAVSEIMIATPAVRNLIREAKTHQIDNVIRTSADIGMISLEHSLVKLVRDGSISMEKAQQYAVHPEEVVRLLKS